ncbi:MAG: molybdenum cofactor biosynthesis protein MoaE [Anaerolineae bacterium]|nr:molybdenum cofactor biosynthesis protein MoaE [Anaerolineae bacterium]
MQIEVLLFATLRDLAGKKKIVLSIAGESTTIKHVRQQMIDRYPNMEANLKIASAALNDEFVFDSDIVNDGGEVAFFPPVSGGSGDYPEIFRLPTEPVDHDEIVAAITTPATGAVCLFSGMVRGETKKEGHLPKTEYLEYEAYESMAIAKMQQVANEIRDRYPLVQGIAIMQRIGKLKVGQNTVLIACSSGHRDEGCFEAARYGIDRLKEIVPVWKKRGRCGWRNMD